MIYCDSLASFYSIIRALSQALSLTFHDNVQVDDECKTCTCYTPPKPVAFVKLPNIKFACIELLLVVTVYKTLCSQAIYIYLKCVWSHYPQNSMIFLLSRGSSELLNLKNQFRLTIDTTRTRLDVYSRKISWSAFSAISLSKGSYSQDSTGEDPSIICSVSQVLLIGSKAAACSGSQLRRFGCMRQTRPNPSKSPKSVSPSSQHGPQAEQ